MTKNPVNTGTGNKYQAETDYAGIGAMPLAFIRHYNSRLLRPNTTPNLTKGHWSRLGPNWRSSYDRFIRFTDAGRFPTAVAYRADDKIFYFKLISGQFVPDADIADQLVRLTDASGNTTGWQYIVADESAETYDADGKLVSVANRAGLTQTLAYDGQGRLATVTDLFGRTLSFTYDTSNRMATMTDPSGGIYAYSYNSVNNVNTVTYPDGKVRTYAYNESANTSGMNLPYALTGITDENGKRFATYKYDTQGRAVSSEHANGAERVTLTYNTNGTTTVTDALGTARIYGFQTVLGVVKNTSISQPCTGCSGASAMTYDANGNVASRTDFNGNRTNYTYDLTRNLEIEHVDALTNTGATTPQTRTLSTQWHPLYRLPIQITEPGRVTNFTYDANGNLLQKTITADTRTRTWTYTYNTNGQVLTINGPRTDVADVTSYTYDAQGNLATITNALGHVTQIPEYDAHGHPLRIVDPNGVEILLTYDARQRLKTRAVAGAATSFDYDGVGQLSKVTLPDGAFLSYTYDPAHRLTGIQDNAGNSIQYTLDALGNRTQEDVRDPGTILRRTQRQVFDPLSRLKEIHGANGQLTEYGYDAQGNRTGQTEAGSFSTGYAYDALHRLTQVTDAENGATAYGYDPLDRLTAVTDPKGLSTSYSYSALDDLMQQQSPDTGITVYAHDSAGNRSTRTDARGVTVSYSYDTLNRPTFADYPGSAEDITYHYDGSNYTGAIPNGTGRLTGIQDESGATTIVYDARGNVTSENKVIGNTTYVTGYSYDAADRLTGMTYPTGREVGYEHDPQGRITRVTTTADGVTRTVADPIQYLPFGGVSQYTLGNGVTVTRTHDLDYRLEELKDEGTAIVRNLKLYYDLRNNIEAIENIADPARSQTFGYDALSRLNSAEGAYGMQTYSYDAVGNRLTETVTPPGGSASTDTYTYPGTSHRLQSITGGNPQSFSYNAAGNITQKGALTLSYNSSNRLRRVTRQSTPQGTYLYNALGLRTVKFTPQAAITYHYDNHGRLLEEFIRAGGQSYRRAYVWADDQPLAQIVRFPNNGTPVERLSYLHTDHLDTPRLATDAQGTVVWRWEGTAFGTTAPEQDPDGNGLKTRINLRFPGQYYDAEAGLHYNYFRDYDPSIGRYLQFDPIGLSGGINGYIYANANPLSYIDPDGLLFWGYIDAGESYGDSAAQYWADQATQTGNPLYHVPGALASLWTPETSDETAATLVCGAGAGAYLGRPFWRYVGPKSNPNSQWMTRGPGWKPPYGSDMAKAKDKLQLPHMPTGVEKTPVPWSQPVRGPRPANGHPEWGSGGGPEYIRGGR